jgi:energy-coupling factor transport system ATP-binding protein
MISVRNLSFKYEGRADFALRGATLEVASGGFLGVVGRSGTGKSTLLAAMNGIVPHHFRGEFYGEVKIDGLDTLETPLEELAKKIGYVGQDIESQLVTTTVEDEILFGLENFGTPRGELEARLTEALARVGIAELRERELDSLSGGQKQKVVLCAVIALSPQALVLDEPTGELDPQSSRALFKLLRELNEKSGLTVVVAEQKASLLCEFAKDLAVLEKGKIVMQGTAREILAQGRELAAAGVAVPPTAALAARLREQRLYDGPTPVDLVEAAVMVRSVAA